MGQVAVSSDSRGLSNRVPELTVPTESAAPTPSAQLSVPHRKERRANGSPVVPTPSSRGARECLKLLLWYARRYTRVFPSQAKLASRLSVSDRQLRTYIAELRRAGAVSVRQGGDGRTASYVLAPNAKDFVDFRPGFRADFRAEFRAEKTGIRGKLVGDQEVVDKEFRAERPQHNSSSRNSCNRQSEYRVQEPREPVTRLIEPSAWGQTETAAVELHVRGCGFEPTNELMAGLRRKAFFYDVNGFVVAAAIDRAWRRALRTPSARPQSANWITAVVDNDLRGSSRAEVKPGSGAPALKLARSMIQVDYPRASIDPTPSNTQVNYLAVPELGDVDSVETVDDCLSDAEPIDVDSIDTEDDSGSQPPRQNRMPTAPTQASLAPVELTVADRKLLWELRKTYPFASRANLLEALSELRGRSVQTR